MLGEVSVFISIPQMRLLRLKVLKEDTRAPVSQDHMPLRIRVPNFFLTCLQTWARFPIRSHGPAAVRALSLRLTLLSKTSRSLLPAGCRVLEDGQESYGMLCVSVFTRTLYFLAVPDNREFTFNFAQANKGERELEVNYVQRVECLPSATWCSHVCRKTWEKAGIKAWICSIFKGKPT